MSSSYEPQLAACSSALRLSYKRPSQRVIFGTKTNVRNTGLEANVGEVLTTGRKIRRKESVSRTVRKMAVRLRMRC